MTHTHSPRKIANGLTLYICSCGARQQKSKIVNGLKVEVWHVESEEEEATRHRAVEMIQTEGYGYDRNKQDANDPLDSHMPNID